MTVEDRERAILVMAGACQRLTVDDIEALCELAIDEDSLTLVEMILNPAIWRNR